MNYILTKVSKTKQGAEYCIQQPNICVRKDVGEGDGQIFQHKTLIYA